MSNSGGLTLTSSNVVNSLLAEYTWQSNELRMIYDNDCECGAPYEILVMFGY